MLCYRCNEDAIARCYHCGQLYCGRHGKHSCDLCATSIAEGDPSPDRICVPSMKVKAAPAPWWRPKPAEQVVIPACRVCGGLTRTRCQNCGDYFCHEHAGTSILCQECDRSSWMGLIAIFGAICAAAVLMLLIHFLGY